MTDLAAIKERHTPYNVEARRILGVERCRSDRQTWPCDAAQLLALLADTPSVEPPDVETLARARHRWQHPSYPFAARNRCGCPAWAKEVRQMLALYDEEAALPTQASDSPEKPEGGRP